MPHSGGRGGPGRGGGKKKGSINKKTALMREIAQKALTSGCSPLDIMLENMRFYFSKADEIVARVEDCIKRNKALEAVEALRELMNTRMAAQKCANDCANYVHPRLSNIALSGQVNTETKLILGVMTPQEAAEAYAATLRDNSAGQMKLVPTTKVIEHVE